MALAAALKQRSPVGVELRDLIAQKPGGESIKLSAPRIRAFAIGGHLSPYKGRGVEFDESRPYQAGDDLRTIDWRVTARTGKPHTKVFREERNRPCMVWLDLRASMLFATQGAYKAVRAADMAALIAWSTIGNGDQLGGLIFSDSEHHELRPRLGRRAALRLLQLIADSGCWHGIKTAEADSAPLEQPLLRLTRVVRPGSMMFLLSDFATLDDDDERHIKQLARHGDLFLVHFFDPIEAELPPPGRYRIQMGTRSISIETGDAAVRRRYRERFAARIARLQALERLPGVTVMDCRTVDDAYTVLARRFARA